MHGGRESTGELCQQGLAGRKVRQHCHLRSGEQSIAGDAALDHQVRIRLGEITQCLGHRADVALHEGNRGRAGQQVSNRFLGTIGNCQANQGVLVHLVVTTGGGQLAAQVGQRSDGQAAVFGKHCAIGRGKTLPYLVDYGDLVSPRIVHGPSTERSAQGWAADTIEW